MVSAATRRAVVALALAPVLAHPSARATTVDIVTEEYPPYNFTDPQGRITGLGTEVVRAVLNEIGIVGRIQSMPWARAYDLALHGENVLIYSINRSREREASFKWIGPITPSDFYLFSLQNRPITLQSLDDARRLQIGTVNQDVGEQHLIAHGFTVGRELQSSNRYDINYSKLRMGRIDLWVMNEAGAYFMVRQHGDDPAAVLYKSLRLPEISEGGNFMAFGRRTPDALVERFRKGLETIKRNGVYDTLLQKWL